MGWYDSLGGKTEKINMNNFSGGSAAKNFGDAFKDIGKLMIDNEVAKDKAKLTDLQVQNEQNKLDEFKDAKKQKKFDDAFSLDIKTLDSSASPEATQNAVDALKSFHTPSVAAVALQEQETKTKAADFQNTQNKQYLGDAWTLDPTASKDARQNATDALGEFYKPDPTTQDKVSERFKGLDNIAQTKFNDEAIEVSVSKGYKNIKEFTDANPELVKNADGSTMAKIDTYFAGKDTTARDLADRLKEIKAATTIQNLQGNVTEAQIRAAGSGGSGGEKSTLPREQFEYKQKRDVVLDEQENKTIRSKDVGDVFTKLEGFKNLPKSDQLLYQKEYIKNGYIPIPVTEKGIIYDSHIIEPFSNYSSTKKDSISKNDDYEAKAQEYVRKK